MGYLIDILSTPENVRRFLFLKLYWRKSKMTRFFTIFSRIRSLRSDSVYRHSNHKEKGQLTIGGNLTLKRIHAGRDINQLNYHIFILYPIFGWLKYRLFFKSKISWNIPFCTNSVKWQKNKWTYLRLHTIALDFW